MADRYTKTVQGRQEIRLRALTLSRTARNLLLIIDSSRSLPEWLAMVQGSTESDGASLIEAGLIERVVKPASADFAGGVSPVASLGGVAPSSSQPPTVRSSGVSSDTGAAPTQSRTRLMGHPTSADSPETRPPSPLQSVQSAAPRPAVVTAPAGTTGLSYSELYDCLNALLKETLGLFKGYRFSLEIERASDLRELEEVARRFADEVERTRGENVARMVRRALGLKH